jgi:hypothetical protein
LSNGRWNHMPPRRENVASIFHRGYLYLGFRSRDWMSQVFYEVQRRILTSFYGRPIFDRNDIRGWSHLRWMLEPCRRIGATHILVYCCSKFPRWTQSKFQLSRSLCGSNYYRRYSCWSISHCQLEIFRRHRRRC